MYIRPKKKELTSEMLNELTHLKNIINNIDSDSYIFILDRNLSDLFNEFERKTLNEWQQ